MNGLVEITKKLRSPETKVVLKAVEELRLRGYLMDGSLRNRAFLHVHFEGADLMEADLVNVDLHQAHMEYADLSKANMTGAKLVRANLEGANFADTILEGADLFKVNMKGARNLTPAQLKTAKRLIGATTSDGSIYDGRYNLQGDLDFIAWAKVAPGDILHIAELHGVSADTYLRGQELGKMNDEPVETKMEKILVIDDDPDIVLFVKTTLKQFGVVVVDAPNGTKGLEMVRAEKPDMIILDVMMDTPTEGFEVARTLRMTEEWADFKETPILMLTSVHSTTPVQVEPDVSDVPVDLFVDKPIDPSDLTNKVAWVLGREPEF